LRTGANGLEATIIIVALLERGYLVRGLLRDFGKYKGPEHKDLELVTGDITDYRKMQEVLTECDSVIHVAALTSHDINHFTPYKNINIDATESLIQQSISKGIKKFIYVSSANAFGFGTLENPGTENTPIRPPLF
jgi:dihydroflavonol-4-reductase